MELYFVNIGLYFVYQMLLALTTIVPLLLTVAFYTIGERKAMGKIQRRKGPNVVGFLGLLQPIADGLKLIIKEIIIPRKANAPIYLIAPLLTFGLSLLAWAVIPFNFGNCYSDLPLGVLYLLALSGLNVYGVILSGWASNSKYSLLGGLRAAAQMISYEIPIGLCIIPVVMITGSLNLTEIMFYQTIVVWNIVPLFPLGVVMFISILVETNRSPFDLPEAEAEIVAGYNLEYSGILFAMFFLGEYGNMILMSALMVIFFFGGWAFLPDYLLGEFIFAIKTIIVAFLFILVRAILPRYRFDHLMVIGWKAILPVVLGFFIFVSSVLVGFNLLPLNMILLYDETDKMYDLFILSPDYPRIPFSDWLGKNVEFFYKSHDGILEAFEKKTIFDESTQFSVLSDGTIELYGKIEEQKPCSSCNCPE